MLAYSSRPISSPIYVQQVKARLFLLQQSNKNPEFTLAGPDWSSVHPWTNYISLEMQHSDWPGLVTCVGDQNNRSPYDGCLVSIYPVNEQMRDWPSEQEWESILERKHTGFFFLTQGSLSQQKVTVCSENLFTLTVNSQLAICGRFCLDYPGHRFNPRPEPLALQGSKQNSEAKLNYFQVPFKQKGFIPLL